MPRRLTTKEFCEKLKNINPSISIKSDYVDSQTKVKCACTICGNEWESLPKTLFAGHGCAKCHYVKLSTTKKTSHQEFIEKVQSINPKVEVIGQYEGVNKKIACRCKICKNEWLPTPYTLYKGHGCSTCSGFKRRDTSSFISEMLEINPNIVIIGEFAGVEKKIKCKCNICGDVFWGIPTVLLNGGGCASCAGNKKKTTTTFTEELKKVNDNIEVLEAYTNLYTKIKCRCKICGDIWDAIPKGLLKGHGCASCANNKKKDTKSFSKEIEEQNPLIKVLGEYVNNKTPIKCSCLICGNEWEVRPSYLLRGQGCPECYHSSSSFMEMFIFEAFVHAMGDGKVLHRDEKIIGSELDIVIPELKLAIEPGSYFWHKDKIKKDYAKQIKAKEENYRLIIIYDACKDASQAMREDVWLYQKDLGGDASGNELREVVLRLFKEVGLRNIFSELEWKQITDKAYLKSRRKTTEQFIEEVQLINSSIEVLGEYTKSNDRIKCRCKICKHVWNPNSESLLMGHGCPKCAFVANGKRSSKRVLCITTGEVFDSITAAAKSCNGHTSAISKCCRGEQRKSSGLEWKYYED